MFGWERLAGVGPCLCRFVSLAWEFAWIVFKLQHTSWVFPGRSCTRDALPHCSLEFAGFATGVSEG